jgi:Ser/Thr protein kinase RdoA (MazF antagonist)
VNDRNEDGGGKDGLKTPAGTPIPNPGNGSPFDLLSPDIIFDAVQSAYDIKPDGRLSPCSSYVNRVYGLSSEAGDDYVVKFYRPGRWSEKAIREEQAFLADCQKAEIPVIAPVENSEGEGLSAFDLEPEEENGLGPLRFFFTLYPKRGGRNFDAEGDSDWLRLGRLAGRLHAAGSLRDAPSRVRIGPELALSNLEKIEALIHPEFRAEFVDLCKDAIKAGYETMSSPRVQRIHGDLHRGNILERPGEGLLLLDFDDMAIGPPIQDLWLLLPGRAAECGRELGLLMEGYAEFGELPAGSTSLIESLRLYRMLHFLAWRALQRQDLWFKKEFPDWGSRAFWIQELEDFREQAKVIISEAGA